VPGFPIKEELVVVIVPNNAFVALSLNKQLSIVVTPPPVLTTLLVEFPRLILIKVELEMEVVKALLATEIAEPYLPATLSSKAQLATIKLDP
jgi:hypothetical protein